MLLLLFRPFGGAAPPPLEVIDVYSDEPERRRLQKEKKQVQRHELERIYDKIVLGIEPAIAEEAVDLVRPFARSDAARPSLKSIDWERFIQNVEAIERMQMLEHKMRALEIKRDDDDMEDLTSLQ